MILKTRRLLWTQLMVNEGILLSLETRKLIIGGSDHAVIGSLLLPKLKEKC